MRAMRIWIEVLAAAFAVGLGLAGCDEEGSGDSPDAGDGGSDTEWHSPFDGSVWGEDAGEDEEVEPECECSDPTCGIEYTCNPGEKECLCDTVCDSAVFLPLGWGPLLQNYRCYEDCEGGGSCSREGDVCTDLAFIGGPELCFPRMYVESGEFEIKVAQTHDEWSVADAAQVDVQLLVNGEERHLVMAGAWGGGPPPYVEMVFMEMDPYEYYYLDVFVYGDFWAPGTIELTTDDISQLDARLYLIGDEQWMVGQALTGTMELVETTEPASCDGPGCPKSAIGSMNFEVYGLDAQFAEN
jgi:hypothetical protein